MHASIWKFAGDPDQLLRSYDAMIAELPTANMVLHACLRADDGIVLIDTCPSRDVYEAFAASPGFRILRERHDLPEPEHVEDFPVHTAFIGGQRV